MLSESDKEKIKKSIEDSCAGGKSPMLPLFACKEVFFVYPGDNIKTYEELANFQPGEKAKALFNAYLDENNLEYEELKNIGVGQFRSKTHTFSVEEACRHGFGLHLGICSTCNDELKKLVEGI